MKRAIIIAAGEGTRWGKYLGVDKHFVPVNGEPIIHRTVRLLREHGMKDIYVVGHDDRYKITGSTLYIPTHNPDYYDADKFLNSSELWQSDDDTIVLYGDVYFTNEAIRRIVNPPKEGWFLYGRPLESQFTGNTDGECFAQYIIPGTLEQHKRELYRLVELYNQGTLWRIGGWEHYRLMIGLPDPTQHLIGGNFIWVDDFTDDFDIPQDYDNFIKNYEQEIDYEYLRS